MNSGESTTSDPMECETTTKNSQNTTTNTKLEKQTNANENNDLVNAQSHNSPTEEAHEQRKSETQPAPTANVTAPRHSNAQQQDDKVSDTPQSTDQAKQNSASKTTSQTEEKSSKETTDQNHAEQTGTQPKKTSSEGKAAWTDNKKRHRNPFEAPMRKLSINLIHTYKHINEVYYKKKRERQAKEKALQLENEARSRSKNDDSMVYNDGHDDENSDYIIKYEECLNERYIVRKRIGKGSFGQVVQAFDTVAKEDVAIKIIKSKSAFFKQANTEIDLLKYLNRKDPHDQWFIVRLKDTFVHFKHQCLVFEKLSCNLYDLLRTTRFLGVSLNLIVKFGRQILKALAFLALPEIDIVHCDLKPENILLRHHKRSAIKVIDFGSSCRTKNTVYTYIQSRFYRSPEVMLGLPYGVPIDMWSLGCILVEMHVGEPLFNGTDEFDQMSRLVAIRGLPPSRLIDEAPKRRTFFERVKRPGVQTKADMKEVGSSRWRLRTRASMYRQKDKRHGKPRAQSLEKILGVHNGGPHSSRSGESGHSAEDYYVFIDLIDRMLDYDPKTRIKPIEALNHPFFRQDANHSSTSKEPANKKSESGSSVIHRTKRSKSAPRR